MTATIPVCLISSSYFPCPRGGLSLLRHPVCGLDESLLMRFNAAPHRNTLTAFLVVSAAFVVAGQSARSGDKIQGLEPGRSTSSPTAPTPEREKDFSTPWEIRRGGPTSGDVMPVPVSPAPNNRSLDPRIEEMLDKRKNWMMQDPAKVDREAELRRALGIRENKPTTIGWKGSKFDDPSGQETSASAPGIHDTLRKGRSNARFDNVDESNSAIEGQESWSALPVESAFKSSMSPMILMTPGLLSNGRTDGSLSSTAGGVLPRPLGGMTGSAAPSVSGLGLGSLRPGAAAEPSPGEQRMQDFERLINPLRSGGGLSGSRLVGDTAAGSTAGDIGAGLGGTGLGAGPGLPSISPIVGSIGPSPFGGDSSAGGLFVPPPSAPVMRARPPVLEIPKRSF